MQVSYSSKGNQRVLLLCNVAMAATIGDLSILSLRVVSCSNGIKYIGGYSEIHQWIYEPQSGVAIKLGELHIMGVRGQAVNNE